MDSECTRAGYDDTGRYRVPILDQCPECRGHGEHHPDCDVSSDDMFPDAGNIYVGAAHVPATVIPFGAQLDLFEQRKWAVVARMRRDLDDPWYLDKLFALARRRLEAGFAAYGSTMYGWDHQTRVENEDEEMADRLVYGTSGEAN
jgi:hypothetical protein